MNLQNGIIYGYYFENMTVGKIYRLDFIYSGKNIIPDLDSNFNYSPGDAVNNIYIRCDGENSAPIRYSINGENENKMIGGVIVPGIERKWETELKVIKSINFQIYGSDGELTTKLAIEVGV